ncbi:MAG: hypothetical protein LDL30_04310 [Desulfovibrio sp.]|nr:hypothetical protein [Desulfovibrio sp.]MCA1986600.1 hypothetical protein [Desulfovibrio sp.]
MADFIPPARIEFILVYACPACGRETLLRPHDAGAPTTCRHCSHVYQPHPLAKSAREAMLTAYAAHQPPAPRCVKVMGLRGLSFTLFDNTGPLQFDALAEVDSLHARLCAESQAGMVPSSMGSTLLIHGVVREMTTPGDFTFAVIEGSSKRAEAFLEFSDLLLPPTALPRGDAVCVQGVCRGLMGSHNPLSMVFSGCRLVGLHGQALPPGGQAADVVAEFPPNSPRNPLDAHVLFQSSRPDDANDGA